MYLAQVRIGSVIGKVDNSQERVVCRASTLCCCFVDTDQLFFSLFHASIMQVNAKATYDFELCASGFNAHALLSLAAAYREVVVTE
jgi:hypothetical protein